MTIRIPPLTSPAIKAYVESLPPDQSCGVPEDGRQCLVANYIRAHVGADVSVVVEVDEIYVWKPGLQDRWTGETSAVVRRIIQRFDALNPDFTLPDDVLPIFGRFWARRSS